MPLLASSSRIGPRAPRGAPAPSRTKGAKDPEELPRHPAPDAPTPGATSSNRDSMGPPGPPLPARRRSLDRPATAELAPIPEAAPLPAARTFQPVVRPPLGLRAAVDLLRGASEVDICERAQRRRLGLTIQKPCNQLGFFICYYPPSRSISAPLVFSSKLRNAAQ